MAERPTAKSKMYGVIETSTRDLQGKPYRGIEYRHMVRGRSVWAILHRHDMEKLRKQGITRQDILNGRVEVWSYPRRTFLGERHPKGFAVTRFVKVTGRRTR